MFRSIGLGFASLAMLAACGPVGPEYTRPETPSSAAAPFIGGTSAAAPTAIPGREAPRPYPEPVPDRPRADVLLVHKALGVQMGKLSRDGAQLGSERGRG